MQKSLGKSYIATLSGKTMAWICFILFFVSVLIRFYMADFEKTIIMYPDEIRYWGIARGFAQGQGISFFGGQAQFYKILYSLFILPAFKLGATTLTIQGVAFINSLLMSSSLFAVFLLARKIGCGNSITLAGLLSAAVAPDFVYTITFFSENLYYPLSIWVVYFTYCFFSEKRAGMRYIYACVCGIAYFAAYLTKEIGLSFVAGFAFVAMYQFFFQQVNKKQIVLASLLAACCFVVPNLLFIKATAAFVGAGYEQQISMNNFSSIYLFLSFVYYLIENLVMAVLVFFIFPVLYAVLNFRNFKNQDKALICFLVGTLVVSIITISFTISMREDTGSISNRQHIRYYAGLFLPFLLLFLHQYNEGQREGGVKQSETFLPRLKIIMILYFACLLFMNNRFVLAMAFDGMGLSFYGYMEKVFGFAIGQPEAAELRFNIGNLLVKFGVICVSCLVARRLFGKKTLRICKWFACLCLIFIQIANTYVSYTSLRPRYAIGRQTQSILERFETKMQQIQEPFLVIPKGFNGGIDTYINNKHAMSVHTDQLVALQGEKRYLSVSDQNLPAYFGVRLPMVKKIEYIVTESGTNFLDLNHVTEVPLDDVPFFKVYRNNDPTKLYLLPGSE